LVDYSALLDIGGAVSIRLFPDLWRFFSKILWNSADYYKSYIVLHLWIFWLLRRFSRLPVILVGTHIRVLFRDSLRFFEILFKILSYHLQTILCSFWNSKIKLLKMYNHPGKSWKYALSISSNYARFEFFMNYWMKCHLTIWPYANDSLRDFPNFFNDVFFTEKGLAILIHAHFHLLLHNHLTISCRTQWTYFWLLMGVYNMCSSRFFTIIF